MLKEMGREWLFRFAILGPRGPTVSVLCNVTQVTLILKVLLLICSRLLNEQLVRCFTDSETVVVPRKQGCGSRKTGVLLHQACC